MYKHTILDFIRAEVLVTVRNEQNSMKKLSYKNSEPWLKNNFQKSHLLKNSWILENIQSWIIRRNGEQMCERVHSFMKWVKWIGIDHPVAFPMDSPYHERELLLTTKRRGGPFSHIRQTKHQTRYECNTFGIKINILLWEPFRHWQCYLWYKFTSNLGWIEPSDKDLQSNTSGWLWDPVTWYHLIFHMLECRIVWLIWLKQIIHVMENWKVEEYFGKTVSHGARVVMMHAMGKTATTSQPSFELSRVPSIGWGIIMLNVHIMRRVHLKMLIPCVCVVDILDFQENDAKQDSIG